jgi:hypothetical protein
MTFDSSKTLVVCRGHRTSGRRGGAPCAEGRLACAGADAIAEAGEGAFAGRAGGRSGRRRHGGSSLARAGFRGRASSSGPGTRTGCVLPAHSSRTRCSASRRSVLIRSAAARGILPGAATPHGTPRRASSRASPYPVGLVEVARTGRGSPAHRPAASHRSPPNRNTSSPVSASSTAATIPVAGTSRPTRVLAFATAGSSSAVVERRAGPSRAATTSPPTTVVGEPAPLPRGPDGTHLICLGAPPVCARQ